MGNCALGDGEIDIVRIAEILGRHNPQITINIEIHPQYGPFRLDLFDKTFFTRHAPPPGDGLVWYLSRHGRRKSFRRFPPVSPRQAGLGRGIRTLETIGPLGKRETRTPPMQQGIIMKTVSGDGGRHE